MKSTLSKEKHTWTHCSAAEDWCSPAPESELSPRPSRLQSGRHSAENRPWASIFEALIQIKTSTSPLSFHHPFMFHRNIIFQLNVIIWGVAWTALSESVRSDVPIALTSVEMECDANGNVAQSFLFFSCLCAKCAFHGRRVEECVCVCV